MATREEFGKFMVTLAAALPRYAPTTGNPDTLAIWYAEIGDLPIESLREAYKRCVRTRDSFPSIREVLEICGRAELSDEDKARDAANLIWALIERKGSQRIDVREEIGDLGAEVVKRVGGWQSVCDGATYANKTSMIAQWRETAAGILRKGRTIGGMNELPGVSAPMVEIKKLAEKHGV